VRRPLPDDHRHLSADELELADDDMPRLCAEHARRNDHDRGGDDISAPDHYYDGAEHDDDNLAADLNDPSLDQFIDYVIEQHEHADYVIVRRADYDKLVAVVNVDYGIIRRTDDVYNAARQLVDNLPDINDLDPS
jgi:hypothetical protein